MYIDKARVNKEGDVIVTKYDKDALVTLADAMQIDNAQIGLSNGEDKFILVDLLNTGVEFTNEAKDFYLHKGSMLPFTHAVAIVGEIKSRGLVHKILGRSNTFYEVKKFKTHEEAHAWFNELRSSQSKNIAG